MYGFTPWRSCHFLPSRVDSTTMLADIRTNHLDVDVANTDAHGKLIVRIFAVGMTALGASKKTVVCP